MSDALQDTLYELLHSGSTSNPALTRLLDDYSTYHVVLVVVGGFFVIVLSVLTAFFWRKFRRSTSASERRWSFERTTYFCLGLLSGAVSLLLTLIVGANLGNARNPREGFIGVVDALGRAQPGTRTHELHQSFTTWLQSETASMPTLIDRRIDERLAWQQPKAIIACALLAVFAVLGVRLWRTMIGKSRVRASSWTMNDRVLLLAGVGTVVSCLLLMLMVIGNTQASIAPIVMTLQFG
ncbi:MAG: hypothetical protein HY828_02660 [Actinobacteria bacterium]|nr:hypothetical protein [Actinomycetota bacterium]